MSNLTDRIRAEFLRRGTTATTAEGGSGRFLYYAVDEMLAEIDSLRAKLEVCTAYAKVCVEDFDLREETVEAFLARFRASKDAFLAACGITLTPDDTPEGT